MTCSAYLPHQAQTGGLVSELKAEVAKYKEMAEVYEEEYQKKEDIINVSANHTLCVCVCVCVWYEWSHS